MTSEQRYPALQRRRVELQQLIYRITQGIQNGTWHDTTNELSAMQQQQVYAQQELGELDEVLEDRAHAQLRNLPATRTEQLQLVVLLIVAALSVATMIFVLGGH